MDKYLSANNFEHSTLKNSDGTPMRYKRNGKNKLWKTRPNEFQIPVKRGLREYGYITHENFTNFNVT
jgi:hypothetical protein